MRKRPFPLDAKTILDLQRTAGNQYVVRLLHPAGRTLEAPNATAPDEAGEESAPLAPERLPSRSILIWPYLIGASVAVGAYAGLVWEFPALVEPGAIGAGVACGAGAWYASRRLLLGQTRQR